MWEGTLTDVGLAITTTRSSPWLVLPTLVGSHPQLIGFIRFGEPVPHGLSARPRVWAGPTKG